MRRLVVEPTGDRLGETLFPGEGAGPCVSEIGGAEMRRQGAAQRVAVERGGLLLLDILDRAALDEQPLHRIKRRQRIVARLQLANFGLNTKQPAEKILDVGSKVDEEVGFGLALKRFRIGARGHQPLMQRRVAGRQMQDEFTVEPDQPAAVVKVGKIEPVSKGEVGHWGLLREEGASNHRQIDATTARRWHG